ncbi:MAG: hypothetical protein OW723_00050 [Buchnera aphidicola (Acyrthosiphon caraganae)]|nr:hypothetical protein [Buchnera aphidicola]WAI18379.1 MAG: hypothetical protein OW723_00050 [Buchnera aphidicola (Acyrthosiphon caraganae)]
MNETINSVLKNRKELLENKKKITALKNSKKKETYMKKIKSISKKNYF